MFISTVIFYKYIQSGGDYQGLYALAADTLYSVHFLKRVCDPGVDFLFLYKLL